MKTFAICFVAVFAVAAARSVIDDKIIDGDATTIEQHPHQITLREDDFHICGGSIISPMRALTAALCFNSNLPASRYLIRAGSTSHFGDAKSQTRSLSRVVTHNQFNEPILTNNIAILFWEEPLIFGSNVDTIRLPAANAPVLYGESATLSGWGWSGDRTTSDLRVITMPLISNEDCNRKLHIIKYNSMQPNLVCSGGVVGRGACNGDFGGPLVQNDTLIGILAYMWRPCASDVPDIFTRVASFIEWINENSK